MDSCEANLPNKPRETFGQCPVITESVNTQNDPLHFSPITTRPTGHSCLRDFAKFHSAGEGPYWVFILVKRAY